MTGLEAGLIRTLVLLTGTAVGSFLGAAAYRVPRGISMAGPRSNCPACTHPLGVMDLIPIFSFFLRRRRCAYCGARISWRYPLMEAATGLITLALFMRHGLGWAFLGYAALAWLAILLAMIDLEHRRLPNILTVPAVALGLLFNLAWFWAGGATVTLAPGPEWQGVWHGALFDPGIWGSYEILAPHFSPIYSTLGVLVGGGVLWLIAVVSRGGMGGGDVKYLAAIGSFLGPGAALLVLFLASFLGAVVGVSLIASHRLQRREPIPFGPFLSLAVIAVAIVG